MKKLDLSFGDGFPLDQETLLFMQTSYFDGIGNLSKAIGDNVILSGCEVTGNTLASGWAVYQNEVLFVQGATKATGEVFTYSILSNTTLATYQGGSVYPSYGDRYIKVIGSPSTPNFVDDFKRITSLKDTNTKVSTLETNYTDISTDLTTLDSRLDSLEAVNIASRLAALEAKNMFKILAKGAQFVGNIPAGTTGMLLNFTFPAPLPHDQYFVLGTFFSIALNGGGSGNLTFCSCQHSTTGFSIKINESFDSTQADIFRYYVVEALT